eukprot:CAMPEP_0178924044 /NCGR_PEP_ID=MMETSP0786-20121207/17100_1 /TAXON_ID=186022 /ORGANISM="Thalassionema frauenfeldii, Strain CCMP 1798" /LENGTH=428 /DNA_ID=CAMNT_0020598695 /DNA_START=174 /DNA_END=1460 /DNA_ORIENTATION=+
MITTTTTNNNNKPDDEEEPPTSTTVNDTTPEEQSSQTKNKCQSSLSCFCNFLKTNEFVLLILLVILLAYAYPPLGAIYLAPQITATWIAVIFIFLLSGIKLKSEEFAKAFSNIYFNAFLQLYNFFVVSAGVYGVSRLLILGDVIPQSLADGMVIGASVPITVNMVLVLTQSANGDEAAAIFNAAFGNMVGVFLSPALILLYLGVSGSVDLGTVFYKLLLRVLLPILVGQVLRKFSPAVVEFVKQHKKIMNKLQEYALVFIVYTVFCKTFSSDNSTASASAGSIFIMIAFIFLLLTFFMILAWYLLKCFFPQRPKLRVMGLFGCTHKSVAMGIPLINAIYETNPNVGYYTLPLLVWHPMQLVIGSFLAPKLSDFVTREEERLGLKSEEEEEDDDNNTHEKDDNEVVEEKEDENDKENKTKEEEEEKLDV